MKSEGEEVVSTSARIQELESQIRAKLEFRARLMESFVDAPGIMQSKSDHTRQDLATEIAAVDESIHELRDVIHQVESLSPQATDTVQVGHAVRLRIDGEDAGRYLLLEGAGGIRLGEVTTLSISTPIGRAICGAHVGSRVKAAVPGGQIEIEIMSVE